MLPSDTVEAARAMEAELGGLHFWDDRRLAAAAFAEALGGGPGALAWDMYLHYRPGSDWAVPAPSPADFAHQLGVEPWPDPARFAWGEALGARLQAFGRETPSS